MIIDITRLTGRLLVGRLPTGVDRVDIEYVRHYHFSSTALIRYRGRWLFLSSRQSQEIFQILITQDGTKRWKILLYVFLSFFSINRLGNTEGKRLLNISHSGLDDTRYAQNIERFGLKPIYFIHDLIPIEYPEYSRLGEAQRHQQRLNTALDTATSMIIVNSNDTQNRLKLYADGLKAPHPQCVVAHLGITSLSQSDEKAFLSQPYFVIIGTIEGRKNHVLILNIWRDLVNTIGEDTPLLVIIGQRGWEASHVFTLLDRCESIRPYILEQPKCSDTELSRWLIHARALLFPSFVEGYGLPLVEALSMGVPVIASDLAVFREIANDTPEYVNPIDGIGWQTMIQEYTQSNSKSRLAQLLRMASFVPASWDKHFEIVDSFLKAIKK